MSKVRMLTKLGHVTSELQTSVCSGSCIECADDGKIPLAHINGSAYIIGIFSMHERNAGQPFKVASCLTVTRIWVGFCGTVWLLSHSLIGFSHTTGFCRYNWIFSLSLDSLTAIEFTDYR